LGGLKKIGESMPKLRVGVQLAPQGTTYAAYAQAVQGVEALGVDTLWNWDHFFPPLGSPPETGHYEAWTMLTAMATLTRRVEVGCLVTCVHYRNPALLANMAKTLDHISHGRLILGLGAGWFEPDFQEYGYHFAPAGERLRVLETTVPFIRQRWEAEWPRPVRSPIPILIGGDGERVTLRIVAQYADLWNGGRSPEDYKRKSALLDTWCGQVGRPPEAIERTVTVYGNPTPATFDDYVAAGAQHIILNLGSPWDLTLVEQLVQWRAARQGARA
jgi:probable F420-dependent oxidoreductase